MRQPQLIPITSSCTALWRSVQGSPAGGYVLNPDFVAAVAEIAGALTSNPSQVNGYISTLFGDFGERPHLPSMLPCVGLSEQRRARFLPALAAPMPIRAFAHPPSRSFGLGPVL